MTVYECWPIESNRLVLLALLESIVSCAYVEVQSPDPVPSYKAIWPSSLHFHSTQASQISLGVLKVTYLIWLNMEKCIRFFIWKNLFRIDDKKLCYKNQHIWGSLVPHSKPNRQVSSWVPIENFLVQMWSLLFDKSWIELRVQKLITRLV